MTARLFAVALIIGFGFSQLLASWHEAGVRHVRCAEHGEMVDVEASHGPVFSDGRATGTTVEGAESATPSEHEHCAVALALGGVPNFRSSGLLCGSSLLPWRCGLLSIQRRDRGAPLSWPARPRLLLLQSDPSTQAAARTWFCLRLR